jgi:hypothetical protein
VNIGLAQTLRAPHEVEVAEEGAVLRLVVVRLSASLTARRPSDSITALPYGKRVTCRKSHKTDHGSAIAGLMCRRLLEALQPVVMRTVS